MRSRYWVMMGGSIITGLAVGGVASAFTLAGTHRVDESTLHLVLVVSWVTMFLTPALMSAYFRNHPIDYEETTMAHIESAKGTVKFDDECLEYDFIHTVRQHPEVQAKFYESIAAWESAELIADDMRSELWITTLDAIPLPGIHRDLFGRYLQSLDWHEIATYYIEQYEQEHANDER